MRGQREREREREREGEELHSGLGLAQGENEWGRRKGVGPARVKGVAHPGRVHQPCWRHGMWDDASVADAPLRHVSPARFALLPRWHGNGASLSGAPKRTISGLSFSRGLFIK